ncbi:RrF2 family transcriptional regulator [Flagellimonas allohymeniacidonis]|uniref:Rrf2 family transcriptional regulator n=1 Tax=Flagellimonas allohymeniacidonis TaxID=2517819 RepID=A0A4Q8QC55_9FLAO|nr:Rrf2 family transcriptional regulator [Allomuricauda hymeniacidonis]TAI46668.1 Rrf2 family transcriptional regulator [Allomuricauda hymeniacidonis]
MLSKSSKYAIKGVLFLALNSDEKKKVQAKDLSAPINAPSSYIAKLLQELVRHGIVSSLKGPKGGFYLNDDNRQVSVMRIVDVIDGHDKFSSCMLSLEECDAENPCPLHDLVSNGKSEVVKNLENTTIEALVSEIQLGKSVLPL